MDDGRALHRVASDAGGLDVNTVYAYVLWCRDFAGTSVLAEDGGVPCGFVTGYRRPSAPTTLFVWQVAVAPDHRGQGLAARMLDDLVAGQVREGATHLEATVTPSNAASTAMFAGVARRWDAPIVDPAPGGFPASVLADGHEAEDLLRIGPFPAS